MKVITKYGQIYYVDKIYSIQYTHSFGEWEINLCGDVAGKPETIYLGAYSSHVLSKSAIRVYLSMLAELLELGDIVMMPTSAKHMKEILELIGK